MKSIKHCIGLQRIQSQALKIERPGAGMVIGNLCKQGDCWNPISKQDMFHIQKGTWFDEVDEWK